jgi:hypothetical protein
MTFLSNVENRYSLDLGGIKLTEVGTRNIRMVFRQIPSLSLLKRTLNGVTRFKLSSPCICLQYNFRLITSLFGKFGFFLQMDTRCGDIPVHYSLAEPKSLLFSFFPSHFKWQHVKTIELNETVEASSSFSLHVERRRNYIY